MHIYIYIYILYIYVYSSCIYVYIYSSFQDDKLASRKQKLIMKFSEKCKNSITS